MITFDYDNKKGKGIIFGDEFGEIREHFSVPNPAAKFARGYSYIPKRLYAITPTGQFNVGLAGEIEMYINSVQKTILVNKTESFVLAYCPSLSLIPSTKLNIELRDYQSDAIKLCVRNGRGIIKLGTGAGKTLVIASLIETFYADNKLLRILVIVPDLGLTTQTNNDFINYGVNFTHSIWTGSTVLDQGTNVCIVNSSNLQSKFEDNEWIKFVDVVIVDEAHKCGSSTKLSKMISQIKTNHKFGFTGTLPESNIDKWNVIGKIGPVLIDMSSYELRESGFLSDVKIDIFNIQYNTKPAYVKSGSTTANYLAELDFLKSSTYRNNVIKSICNNFNQNILILVNHIEHGEKLFQLLTDKLSEKKSIYFIRGEVDVDEREKIKNIMEVQQNVICVAISAIFSTGINIKNIHMIIFAAGGKSFIRTVQSIGRGLRLHENKVNLKIIDISDNLKYGKQHSDARIKIYDKEKIKYISHNLQSSVE